MTAAAPTTHVSASASPASRRRRARNVNPEPAWHAGFLRLLPAIRRHACHCFRRLPRDAREEAIQEAIANALVAYARLAELGREEIAYASPLGRYAVAQVRDGRKVGTRRNVRDVLSSLCQYRKSFRIERLDRFDESASKWETIVVEDRRSTPAEIAAIRIDFRNWLAALPYRERRIAEILATGEPTTTAARMFHVSAGRISQLRREFYEGWQRFHGESADDSALAIA